MCAVSISFFAAAITLICINFWQIEFRIPEELIALTKHFII
jgi:hypothetical protein